MSSIRIGKRDTDRLIADHRGTTAGGGDHGRSVRSEYANETRFDHLQKLGCQRAQVRRTSAEGRSQAKFPRGIHRRQRGAKGNGRTKAVLAVHLSQRRGRGGNDRQGIRVHSPVA